MEAQSHRTHDPHSYESLDSSGSDVHGHSHHDEADTVDDSPAVRCGLVEPTDMGQPVLVEDLYATHSDIVDPPVRSFAQWEEEEKRGAPPPLSTGIYGTELSDPTSQVGHLVYGQDANKEKQKEDIGKSTVMDEKPVTPIGKSTVIGPTGKLITVDPTGKSTAVGPTNTDIRSTGQKEPGIADISRSFDKMNVHDRPGPESKTLKSDQKEPMEYAGSHDQFDPEPVQNAPPDTVAGDPSIGSKAATAKDMIASKLASSGENKSKTSVGEEKPNKKSSFSTTDYAHKVADTLSGTLGPVYERVIGSGTSAIYRIRGSGHEENTLCTPMTKINREPEGKGVGVIKEYLVDTFKPGDDDKVLSEVITQAFHRGKPAQETHTITTTHVVDEGERRLQDSGN